MTNGPTQMCEVNIPVEAKFPRLKDSRFDVLLDEFIASDDSEWQLNPKAISYDPGVLAGILQRRIWRRNLAIQVDYDDEIIHLYSREPQEELVAEVMSILRSEYSVEGKLKDLEYALLTQANMESEEIDRSQQAINDQEEVDARSLDIKSNDGEEQNSSHIV